MGTIPARLIISSLRRSPVDVKKIVEDDVLTEDVVYQIARASNLKTSRIVTTVTGKKVRLVLCCECFLRS